jgi:hypothetical protein
MKKIILTVSVAVGYLVAVSALFNFTRTVVYRGGESTPSGSLLFLVAVVVAIAISRSKARRIATTLAEKDGPAGTFRFVVETMIRLSAGWAAVSSVAAVLAAISSGGIGTAAVAAAGVSLSAGVLLFGFAMVLCVDVPWRIGRRRQRNCVPSPKGAVVAGVSPVTEFIRVRYPLGWGRTERPKRNLVPLVVGLVLVGGVWGGFRLRDGSASDLGERKVEIVALNDQVTDAPPSEKRMDVIHAVVIVRNGWITFDGGWRDTKADEAAALRLAVFEAKRRAGTAIQIAFRPRYDKAVGIFIYDSVKFHEPDGTFVYSK